jgi:hypothetical protein
MLYMGGCFSPKGAVHSEYKALLKANHEAKFKGMYRSLEDLMEILHDFIWSEKAYRMQLDRFWEEIQPDLVLN